MKSRIVKNQIVTTYKSKEWYSYPITPSFTYYTLHTIVAKARKLGGKVVNDCVIDFSTEEGIIEFDLFIKNFFYKS